MTGEGTPSPPGQPGPGGIADLPRFLLSAVRVRRDDRQNITCKSLYNHNSTDAKSCQPNFQKNIVSNLFNIPCSFCFSLFTFLKYIYFADRLFLNTMFFAENRLNLLLYSMKGKNKIVKRNTTCYNGHIPIFLMYNLPFQGHYDMSQSEFIICRKGQFVV